jgi:hypothetical protein
MNQLKWLIVTHLFLTSAIASECQIAKFDNPNLITIPCVEIEGNFSTLQLKPYQSNLWQLDSLQEIQCQPTAKQCATVDKHLNIKIPILINNINYIVHLKPDAHLKAWQYRYHYQNDEDSNLKSKVLSNEVAYIPPQCYTKTIDSENNVHNPCFTCHQESLPPNYNNDADLQESYAFPEYALTNHWSNLFKDRSQAVAAISDAEILAYIRTDNYQDKKGHIILADTLQMVPTVYDVNQNGRWDGFIPDCYFNFDAQGFDQNNAGEYTGWRAFAYYPFPGTFWPANGSTDDVLIRLPPPFQQNENGEFDLSVYKLNLAIVEALIKRENVAISKTDERLYGVDLDQDGDLASATEIVYHWAPLEGRQMRYVGKAKQALEAGEQYLAGGLFPLGTEFLHSVRYIDLDEGNQIKMAARMKELRYARKTSWRSYSQHQNFALSEIKEADAFPDRLDHIIGNLEEGVSNQFGWILQGFIEDQKGDLRPQTYEEHVFCVGCHSTLGATTDGMFAFPRKLPGADTWSHWSQKGLKNIPEPLRKDGEYEYSFYLEHNGAGDEFRANTEIISNFFDENGLLKADKISALHQDISLLLWPSPARALQLNKAYRVIVQEQSFKAGRDATVIPPENVHQKVFEEQTTGIEQLLNGF